jgi:xanthine dehydrogenase YagS FAD-binding subunit
VLEHGWLIDAIHVPAPAPGARATYRKVRDRASFAFAVSSIGAIVDIADDGTVRDVRIALGAVAPVPWRARRAEAALLGRHLDEPTIAAAIDDELALADPLPGNAFKVTLVHNLVVSTLLELAAS